MSIVLTPSSSLEKAVLRLGEPEEFTRKEARRAFDIVLRSDPDEALYDTLMNNLAMRPITMELLCGAADALRERMIKVVAPNPMMDVCGTGGDGRNTLNISTATAFVTAACGVKVAKHGNARVSSKSGSTDVLSALGVKLAVAPVRTAASIQHAGLGFIAAQQHHPILKKLASARSRFGRRTLFNVVGPLANPASVELQLLGVPSDDLVEVVGGALRALGVARAWVVHGYDGVDEVSLSGRTRVYEVRGTNSREFMIEPEDAALERRPLSDLEGGDATENAEAIRALLTGATGPFREAVMLNTAAALAVAGRASDLAQGARLAAAAIDSGAAKRVLDDVVAITNADHA